MKVKKPMIETTYTKEEITEQLNKLSMIVNGYYSDIIYDAIQIIEKRCNNMLTIKFFCKDGNTFSIQCDELEEHKMTDEIYLYKNGAVNAKINTLAIAAYEIVESEEQ